MSRFIHSWTTILFSYLLCLQPGLRAKVRTASKVSLPQFDKSIFCVMGKCSETTAHMLRRNCWVNSVHSFLIFNCYISNFKPLPSPITYVPTSTCSHFCDQPPIFKAYRPVFPYFRSFSPFFIPFIIFLTSFQTYLATFISL